MEDTILDQCRGARDNEVIHLVTQAIQDRRTTPARLRRPMAGRGRMSHRALLLDLLQAVAEGAESPLELAYLRDAERPHCLPRGQRQHRSRHARHCRDVWYKQCRTVVELDGRLGHEGIGRFRDMRLDNLAILAGEVTLRFGWSDVHERACAIAWQVGAVLQQRGWSGQGTRRRNCRLVPTPDFQ